MSNRFKRNFILLVCILAAILATYFIDDKDSFKTDSTEKDHHEYQYENPTTYIEELKELVADYSEENFSLENEYIDAIINSIETPKSCDNELADYGRLVDIIIENSLSESNINCPFLEKDREDISGERKREDVLFRSALKEAIDIIFYNSRDPREDICTLKDLKISLGMTDSYDLTKYDESSKILTIDYTSCTRQYLHSDSPWTGESSYLASIIAMELNRIRIETCDCRRIKGEEITSIQIGAPLSNIKDIACETQVQNYPDFANCEIPCLYLRSFEKRDSEAMLLLLAAFKQDRDIDDYYDSIFSANIKGLHAFFGLHDIDEIAEFYRIAYALDLRAYTGEALSDCYEKLGYYPLSDDEAQSLLGDGYCLSIFKTAIIDVVSEINRARDYTIEEALYLYSLAKSQVVCQAGTLISTPPNFDKGFITYYEPQFIEGIEAIENIFFNYLSAAYGIDKDEIKVKIIEEMPKFEEDSFYNSNIDLAKIKNRFPILSIISRNRKFYLDQNLYYKERLETLRDYNEFMEERKKGTSYSITPLDKN